MLDTLLFFGIIYYIIPGTAVKYRTYPFRETFRETNPASSLFRPRHLLW